MFYFNLYFLKGLLLVGNKFLMSVIKKEKKSLHFSNSVSLSVSYLLKDKSIPLGEIFLLSAQEEKAFLTTFSFPYWFEGKI